MYFDEILLSEKSKIRLNFFLKIEEIQCAIFLFFCREIKANLFLDIGANVGFYSLLLKKYFPKINIVCFEPTPDTFIELISNFQMNPKLDDSIIFHNAAVSSGLGFINLLNFGNCSGKNALEFTSIHDPGQAINKIEVPALRIDDLLLNNMEKPFVSGANTVAIKIDTEGHEFEILRGGSLFLKENDCFLQVEEGHKNSSNEMINFLLDLGYTRIYTAGPDSYFTNNKLLQDPLIISKLVEEAINFILAHRWGKDCQLI